MFDGAGRGETAGGGTNTGAGGAYDMGAGGGMVYMGGGGGGMNTGAEDAWYVLSDGIGVSAASLLILSSRTAWLRRRSSICTRNEVSSGQAGAVPLEHQWAGNRGQERVCGQKPAWCSARAHWGVRRA